MAGPAFPNEVGKTLQLKSEPEGVERAVTFVEDFGRELALEEDILDRLVVAASEAVTNAILHGNASDPRKMVDINLSADKSRILLTVGDEGPGFERESLPDPLLPENLLKTGGRGVFLIESLADEVYYEQGGRYVRMVFTLPQDG